MPGKWVRGGERPPGRAGEIIDARAFELHGTPYYALLYRFDDDAPGVTREARLSAEMAYAEPRRGDRVIIDAVLGVVDRVRRA